MPAEAAPQAGLALPTGHFSAPRYAGLMKPTQPTSTAMSEGWRCIPTSTDSCRRNKAATSRPCARSAPAATLALDVVRVPQLRGLGASAMSQRYAIAGIEEAAAYVAHPVLGPRLVACCEAALDSDVGVQAMFGAPDDLKLRSCATLFAVAAPEVAVFGRLLAEKFDGDWDRRTLELLGHPDDADSSSRHPREGGDPPT